MKQKLNLREKLALRLGTTLEYTAAGIAVAGIVVGILFTFNFLGNKKNAVAHVKASNTITLLPESGGNNNNTREAQPVVSISNTDDSLYIEFSNDTDEPIQNAVLTLKDTDGKMGTVQMAQARVMTSLSQDGTTNKTERFAIPTQYLPQKVHIEARVDIAIDRQAVPVKTSRWSSAFVFNRNNSSVALETPDVKMAVKKQ